MNKIRSKKNKAKVFSLALVATIGTGALIGAVAQACGTTSNDFQSREDILVSEFSGLFNVISDSFIPSTSQFSLIEGLTRGITVLDSTVQEILQIEFSNIPGTITAVETSSTATSSFFTVTIAGNTDLIVQTTNGTIDYEGIDLQIINIEVNNNEVTPGAIYLFANNGLVEPTTDEQTVIDTLRELSNFQAGNASANAIIILGAIERFINSEGVIQSITFNTGISTTLSSNGTIGVTIGSGNSTDNDFVATFTNFNRTFVYTNTNNTTFQINNISVVNGVITSVEDNANTFVNFTEDLNAGAALTTVFNLQRVTDQPPVASPYQRMAWDAILNSYNTINNASETTISELAFYDISATGSLARSILVNKGGTVITVPSTARLSLRFGNQTYLVTEDLTINFTFNTFDLIVQTVATTTEYLNSPEFAIFSAFNLLPVDWLNRPLAPLELSFLGSFQNLVTVLEPVATQQTLVRFNNFIPILLTDVVDNGNQTFQVNLIADGIIPRVILSGGTLNGIQTTILSNRFINNAHAVSTLTVSVSASGDLSVVQNSGTNFEKR